MQTGGSTRRMRPQFQAHPRAVRSERIYGMQGYVPPPWKSATSGRQEAWHVFQVQTDYIQPHDGRHGLHRRNPPHESPRLDHPLSLADAPDLPGMKDGHDALETVPPFPARWLDPEMTFQPIIDFFREVPSKTEQLRPASPIRNAIYGPKLGLILDPAPEYEWRVRDVMPGGSAHDTGCINQGDILKCVDGISLRGLPDKEVTDILRGRDDAHAVLVLQKGDGKNVFTVFAKRGEGVTSHHDEEMLSPRRENLVPKDIAIDGFLEMEIVEGRHLPSTERGKSSHFYVQVLAHGQSQRTRTIHNLSNPHWNENMIISVYNSKSLELKGYGPLRDEARVEVYSVKGAGPQLCGTILFPLNQLVRGLQEHGVGEGWYTLHSFDENLGKFLKVTDISGNSAELFLRLKYSSVVS